MKSSVIVLLAGLVSATLPLMMATGALTVGANGNVRVNVDSYSSLSK